MNVVRLHDSRLVRLLCLGTGLMALGLGILGVVLPVLPTTPFILLAAACFARSSLRFHDWLLRQPVAGAIIQEWQAHRSIPRRAKQAAFVLMAISFGSSIWLLDSDWHRVLLALLAMVLAFFLWRVPVREVSVRRQSDHAT